MVVVVGTVPIALVVVVTTLVVVVGGKRVVVGVSGSLLPPPQPERTNAPANKTATNFFTALLPFTFVLVPEEKTDE